MQSHASENLNITFFVTWKICLVPYKISFHFIEQDIFYSILNVYISVFESGLSIGINVMAIKQMLGIYAESKFHIRLIETFKFPIGLFSLGRL